MINDLYSLMDQLHRSVTALPNYHELRVVVYNREWWELIEKQLTRPIGKATANALISLANLHDIISQVEADQKCDIYTDL